MSHRGFRLLYRDRAPTDPTEEREYTEFKPKTGMAKHYFRSLPFINQGK